MPSPGPGGHLLSHPADTGQLATSIDQENQSCHVESFQDAGIYPKKPPNPAQGSKFKDVSIIILILLLTSSQKNCVLAQPQSS